jgi:hypothetical protein
MCRARRIQETGYRGINGRMEWWNNAPLSYLRVFVVDIFFFPFILCGLGALCGRYFFWEA